jgi:hypothetical protein
LGRGQADVLLEEFACFDKQPVSGAVITYIAGKANCSQEEFIDVVRLINMPATLNLPSDAFHFFVPKQQVEVTVRIGRD